MLIMNIYKDNEELDFENIHLSKFENKFFQLTQKLKEIIEPNFNSISELKNTNKELLAEAFDAELNEII